METEALEGLSVTLDYRVPTSVSNFVHRLSDKTDLFLWKRKDKTVRVKLGVFCSASEQKRELLRQIIWTEAGEPYDLLIFNESSGTDHFVTSSSTLIQNYDSEPLKAFLKLFECHCKNALGMKASEDTLLWQGISEESIRRAADLSKTLEKDLGDYFNLLKEKEEKKDLKGKGKKKDSKREDKKKRIHFPTAIDELTNFILQLKS